MEHLERYPKMTARDCLKFLYQAVLGPKHLGMNGTPPIDYIINELNNLEKINIPLTEDIGNGLCRLNLNSSEFQFNPKTVQALFLKTAVSHCGNLEDLKEQISIVEKYFSENSAEISTEDFRCEVESLEKNNFAPVSHSKIFHENYFPHYRLVKKEFVKYIFVVDKIFNHLDCGKRCLLGIDGRCGSGKSTFAEFLAEIFCCPIIHVDDFFLPFERKTPERLAETGGNLDRERFLEEVIIPYKAEQELSYGVYDCSCGKISHYNKIASNSLRGLVIVEGSYSLHPLYQDAFDIKIFTSCSSELQSQRILARNGEFLHRRFIEEWIPMEEKYFSEFKIAESCDFIIDLS